MHKLLIFLFLLSRGPELDNKTKIVKMNLDARLQQVEGFSAKVYKDRGSMSIGYGHSISENPLPKDLLKRLSDNGKTFGTAPLTMDVTTARHLLKRDIGYFYKAAEKRVPHFEKLSVNRQEALVEMMFNLGETRFRGFKKMLKALDNKDYKKAFDEILDSKWHRERQVGDRSRFIAEKVRRG